MGSILEQGHWTRLLPEVPVQMPQLHGLTLGGNRAAGFGRAAGVTMLIPVGLAEIRQWGGEANRPGERWSQDLG